ncbi:upper zone of growth plate and cartilage matrix associated a [Leucoraja erinacea]|uniref:upper zone of growth plate and cartilage matrix associated a n=1 Tax=Leucoraja erinaceus TaxID=7782 RepID=UPI002454A08D|nr:upper zone of growth plate and cartilage matrix associated a [Leucoraja erinacea]
MRCRRLLLLSSALFALLLAVLSRSDGAVLRPDPGSPAAGVSGPGAGESSLGPRRRLFVSGEVASTFLKRRSKRSTRGELAAEKRQRLSADERRKEYHEEQLNEWENYVEEEQDEQYERNREKVESWRQWHYDGLYPSYQYNRHVY